MLEITPMKESKSKRQIIVSLKESLSFQEHGGEWQKINASLMTHTKIDVLEYAKWHIKAAIEARLPVVTVSNVSLTL